MLRCSKPRHTPYRDDTLQTRNAHINTNMPMKWEELDIAGNSKVVKVKVEYMDASECNLDWSDLALNGVPMNYTLDVYNKSRSTPGDSRTGILPPAPSLPMKTALESDRTCPSKQSMCPRGMVPVSPVPPPRTPPSQAQFRFLVPPKIHRVTAKPNKDLFIHFAPFVANRKYPDLYQQQELQKQREMLRASTYHYRDFWSRPSRVHTNNAMTVPVEPSVLPGYHCAPEAIGDPSMRVYKLRLPANLVKLLDEIIVGCEAYATNRPNGWCTDLYSLTRQDLALVDVPGMMEFAMPLLQYQSRCICELFHTSTVKVDRKQPHVLKYNKDHRGVQLHHDRCDVTANLMMSRGHTYVGGGTYFPDLNKVIRLNHGEFLLHPGTLVHGGTDIVEGTRYLMVLFAHFK